MADLAYRLEVVDVEEEGHIPSMPYLVVRYQSMLTADTRTPLTLETITNEHGQAQSTPSPRSVPLAPGFDVAACITINTDTRQ